MTEESITEESMTEESMTEESTIDLKLAGENNYQNQFKNRSGNHFRNGPTRHIGNCLSLAGSRPAGYSGAASRIANKATLHEIEIHQVSDYKTIDTIRQYRKNNLPSSVTSKQKMNDQEHHKYSGGFGGRNRNQRIIKKKNSKPRLVHLKAIHPNLYLGNLDAVLNLDIETEFDCIINVSQEAIHASHVKGKIYTIDYPDSRTLTFQQFQQIHNQALTILEDNLDTKTLIVCRQGVNRSVSIAIVYAIVSAGMTADQASNLIDGIKLELDPNWNHLTNPKIRNLLNIFEQRTDYHPSPN